jgi:hypothetical protein
VFASCIKLYLIYKEKSIEKIDSAVVTVMGLDRAIRSGVNTGASVYEERGILFI